MKKTGKNKAKLITAIAGMLLASCLLAACQPTPDKPIIQNKSENTLASAIQETPSPQATYDAPASVNKTFNAKDSRVTVNIDAAVSIPKVSKVPVLDIVPDPFTATFVKQAANILFEGQTAYEPRTVMTKSEIQAEIDNLQQALADPKNSKSDGLQADDPKIVKQVTQMFKDRIKIYQKLQAAAPDTYTPKQSDFQFLPAKTFEDPAMYEEESNIWQQNKDDQAKQLLDRSENGQRLVVDATLSGGYYGRINVENYNGSDLVSNVFSFYKSKTLDPNNLLFKPESPTDTQYQACTISADDAIKMAQDLLDRLGIKEMVLASNTPVHQQDITKEAASAAVYGYQIDFQRSYGGMPVIGPNYISYDGKQYGPAYEHESIEIMIHNDQIDSFRWVSPSRQDKTENNNVLLLPFSDIMDAFEKQMSLEYTLEKLSRYAPENPDYKEYIAKMEYGGVDISKIQLGMVRLAIKDQPGAYRMVPAWKFYGSEKVKYKDQKEETVNLANIQGSQNVYETINAIDGSIIDSNLGY